MNESLNLLEQIDKIISLGEKGLARVNETDEVENKIRRFLNSNLDFNSELGREYDRWGRGTWWKTMSKNGYANDTHLAPLQRLREFLTKFLDLSNVEILPLQLYIKTNEVYSGRMVLRNILSRANRYIDIQDNYLNHEVLSILEPYFQNNSVLKARLLTSDKINKAFFSDFSLFLSQFGRVEVKIHDQAHGRFIILDNSEVYTIGHSMKDIGKKADVISKVETEVARGQTVNDFESWWINAKEIK